MSELTAFEKYMNREPLTAELAALREGRTEQVEIPELVQPFQRPTDEEQPLSKAERQALRDARQGGGVTAVIRLLRRSLRIKTRQATIDSENDPLGRQSEIAQNWASIAAFRRACLEIEAMITLEIQELEKEERGQ